MSDAAYFDGIYANYGPLDAFDAAILADAEAARLGCGGFLGAGELSFLEETLALHLPGRGGALLDLGCGRGALGVHVAARLDVDLVGVDFARAAIAQAQADHPGRRARWLCCDFARLELADDAACAALSLDGLYLARDRTGALAELRRVLIRRAPLVFTLCAPSDSQEAALARWDEDLRRAGFHAESVADLTDEWHTWLRRKHERRLANGDELRRLLGEKAATTTLRVSECMLDGDPARYATQARHRVVALSAA